MFQRSLGTTTRGRGSHLITQEFRDYAAETDIPTGVAQMFAHHTSASLMLCENADPEMHADIGALHGPAGAPLFRHTDEGPDDMAAHVRTLLAGPPLSVPVTGGRCALCAPAARHFDGLR